MNLRQLAALTALLSLAASSSFAQKTGGNRDFWYAGVDYGQSKLDGTGSLVNAASRNAESDTFSIRFGYRFTRKFALEAGYVDLGEFSASFVAACPACLPRHSATSIDGFLVNVIGIWPIAERFQLKGALGTTYRRIDAVAVYPAMTDHWSDTGVVLTFDAGVVIPIGERFEIDLDFTLYREDYLFSGTLSPRLGFIDEGEYSRAALGLRYRF